MERWVLYAPLFVGKKILLHIDHSMNSVGAQIAEFAAEMLVSVRVQPDSSVLNVLSTFALR